VYQPGASAIELQAPVLIAVNDVVPWVASPLAVWLERNAVDLSLLDVSDLVVAGDVFEPGAARQSLLSRFAWQRALRPDAQAVARLGLAAWHAGQACRPEQAQPLYVRDKVAFTTREREQGAGGNPRAGV